MERNQVDLAQEAVPYDRRDPASVAFSERHMRHISLCLSLAKDTGISIWERNSSGGLIPYDGTMTVYRPDGIMLRCIVDWRGKHELTKAVASAITIAEAKAIVSSA